MSRKKDENKLSPAQEALEGAAKDEVEEAIEQLQASGQGPKIRFKIYRRPAGSRTWSLWRVVDRDAVDSIEEYCRGEGGRHYDYRYVYIGEDSRRAKDSKGKFIPHGNVWAEETGDPDVKTTTAPEDDIFKQKEKELLDIARRNAQRSREIELKREAAEIERKANSMKRNSRQESMDDRLDEDDDGMMHGHEEDLPPFPIRMPMGPRMRRPYQPPYYPYQPEPRESNSNEVMLAMMNQNTQIIIAALGHQNQKQDDSLIKILPLIMAGQMKPQDYMATMMPMMGEAMKLQGEGARHAMESMGEMQKSMFNQIVKAMLADGRPDDEIDKVKRIAGMVTEGVQDLVKIGLGRDSILRPGQEMKVPVLKQANHNVQRPQQNPQPTPKTNEPVTEPSNGAVAAPDQRALPPAPPPPTQQEVYEAVKTNVRILLIAHERQMHLNNDPTLLLEDDGFDKLMRNLPVTLQDSLSTLVVADIYEELKKYDPEMVDRILKAAASNEKMMSWCQDFWTSFQSEEEEAPEPEPSPTTKE
jgi:hypothetical protein